MQRIKFRRDFIKSGNAAAALETAIVLPVFLLFILGIIQFGYVMWGYASLEYALTAGARYAFVHPTRSETEIKNFTLSRIDFFKESAITIEVSKSSNEAEITGTFSFSPIYILTDTIEITTTVHQEIP